VAALFDVEALWQRRKQGCLTRELFPAVQDDFGAVVVLLNFPTNFDDLACELAHISDALHVVREDDNRKRTEAIVFAKIEVMSFAGRVHANDLACDAFRFADVLGGLVEGDAVGAEGGSGKEQGDRAEMPHRKIVSLSA